MKRAVVLLISLFLLVVIGLTVYVIFKGTNQFKVPTIEKISSIKIVPAKAGGGKRDELSFDLSKKENLDMVNNILLWLKSGQIIGSSKGDMVYNGGTPTYLIIELKDGTTIQVQSAVDAITTKLSNGTEVRGQNVAGQVTLYFSNTRKPIREISPELKSFIDDGWKNFFNYNH